MTHIPLEDEDYWYVDADGITQQTHELLDTEGHKWRLLVGNTFKTQQDAYQEIQHIKNK